MYQDASNTHVSVIAAVSKEANQSETLTSIWWNQ